MERDWAWLGWRCTETGCTARIGDIDVQRLAVHEPDADIRVIGGGGYPARVLKAGPQRKDGICRRLSPPRDQRLAERRAR
jgi:hypothetical protein